MSVTDNEVEIDISVVGELNDGVRRPKFICSERAKLDTGWKRRRRDVSVHDIKADDGVAPGYGAHCHRATRRTPVPRGQDGWVAGLLPPN